MRKKLNPTILVGVFAFAALLSVGQAFAQNYALSPSGVGGPVIQAGTLVNDIIPANDRIAVVGDFEYAVDQYGVQLPNSQNLVFWNGDTWSAPLAVVNEPVKSFASYLGKDYIGTETGICRFNGSQWQKAFSSTQAVWKIFATDNYMLYVVQNSETGDGGFWSDIYYSLDGTNAEFIGTVGNLIKEFAEFQDRIYFGTEIWPEGGTASFDNLGAISTETFNLVSIEKPDAEYLAIGAQVIGVSGGKLYLTSLRLPEERPILSFDGTEWTKAYEGELWGHIVSEELYIFSPDESLGSYLMHLDAAGFLQPVFWNNEEIGASEFFSFKGEFYMSNKGTFTYYNEGEIQTIQSVLIRMQDPSTAIVDQVVNEVSIFPNPASNQLTIDGVIDFSIINSMGQPVPVEFIESSTVNIGSLPSGSYFVRGKSGELVGQFIVQH